MPLCNSCSKPNPSYFQFCRDCGSPLGRIAAPPVRPIGATSVDYSIEIERPAATTAPPAARPAAAAAKSSPPPLPPLAKAAAGGAKVDHCPKCNADVSGYAFCARCGTRITR